MNVETREQFKKWVSSQEAQTIQTNTIEMKNDFWDHKGIFLTQFMEPGNIIISKMYGELINKFGSNTKQTGMLVASVILLHDNVQPHSVACMKVLLKQFNWNFLILITQLTT